MPDMIPQNRPSSVLAKSIREFYSNRFPTAIVAGLFAPNEQWTANETANLRAAAVNGQPVRIVQGGAQYVMAAYLICDQIGVVLSQDTIARVREIFATDRIIYGSVCGVDGTRSVKPVEKASAPAGVSDLDLELFIERIEDLGIVPNDETAQRWMAAYPRLYPPTEGGDLYVDAGISAERATNLSEAFLVSYTDGGTPRECKLKLPRDGVKFGTKYKYPRQGGKGLWGGADGDLYVTFAKSDAGTPGTDIRVGLAITRSQAESGGDLTIYYTRDGVPDSETTISAAPGIAEGDEWWWTGRGNSGTNGGEAGTLYITFTIKEDDMEPARPPAQQLDYAAMAAAAAAKKAAAVLPSMTQEEFVASVSANMIGQTAAIERISTRIRGKLAQRELPDHANKPLVILLPGPTGTGKTELSKALAKTLQTTLARFDMGEYSAEHTIAALVGAPAGYVGSDQPGKLPKAIRDSKKSNRLLVLFDEVEKADKGLWQKLLAFFDEGRCSDSKGTATAPKDTIVIMTTNLCSEEIEADPARAREILADCGFFRPELLGRVNLIVPMSQLSVAENMALIHRFVIRIAKRYDMTFIVTDPEAIPALYNIAEPDIATAGGRGISDMIEEMLAEDFITLSDAGVKEVTLEDRPDRVYAIAA